MKRIGRWDNDEDELLKSLVDKNGIGDEDIDWTALANGFNGTRTSKQVRERWVNHLKPSIKKRTFSENEIKIILEECYKYSKHKYKWSKIAKKIPNTTSLMIKNYYYCNIKNSSSNNSPSVLDLSKKMSLTNILN